MTPLQVLEFFVRHTAFKSTKNISAIANTDPGNLHSCLAGKRALPIHIAQRVAAAVGLVASIEDGQLSLDVASGSIITLEVGTTELINLSGALTSLAPERNYFWRLLVSQEEPVRKGVFAIAITSYKDSYFVINLSCESTDEAYRALEGELPDHLPGKRLPQEPDQFVYSTSNTAWIRLRAGLECTKNLDRMFLKQEQPSLEDWAQLLLELHRKGITPSTVLQTLHKHR